MTTTVTITIPHSFWEIEEAQEDLNSLYDYMANQGIREELMGLDTAIIVLRKVSDSLRREQ